MGYAKLVLAGAISKSDGRNVKLCRVSGSSVLPEVDNVSCLLRYGKADVYIDFASEKSITAEKRSRKIKNKSIEVTKKTMATTAKAEQERQRAEQTESRLQQEQVIRQRLVDRLKAVGVDADLGEE